MRLIRHLAAAALFFTACLSACQVAPPPVSGRPAAPAPTGSADGQTWVQERLDNGLKVIYAPMPQSPVTHVRVLYHVGSRDERTDRQGFAHMFEHMMFRGSAHVKPEEHMKLVGLVGGFSNAFTSFDQTVYFETLPANYTELALWLEADRMSSFRVSPEIFHTERNVVTEEWRMRLNRPYGGMYEMLMPEVFQVHPYRWTPIGDMSHLQAAKTADLQAFFEKYYVPNNAILVVAGNIDVAKTQAQVRKYFAWIPGHGPRAAGDSASWLPLERNIPAEPPQTSPRRLEVKMTAKLPRVLLTFRAPPAASEDVESLDLLLSVLGGGQSSRIYRRLVTSEQPLAVTAGALLEDLEDGGLLGVAATVLAGKDPAEVEKLLKAEIAALRENPVTAEELEKVKQQNRVALATRFETAEDVAGVLGQEMLTYNHLRRVAAARSRLEALTPADLQRVARKYLPDNALNVMLVTPVAQGQSPTPPVGAPAASQPATEPADAAGPARAVNFPSDYPTTAPTSGTLPAATFEKGTEFALSAVTAPAQPPRVVVLEDHRMPIIHWTLALRSGGHAQPKGKEGLAGLTAEMVRRGPTGKTFDQFNEDLESRAIDLDVTDGGDVTRITGRCLKEQFGYAMNAMRDMLRAPAFDPGEFDNLRNQSVSSLRQALNDPSTLAARELSHGLYGDSPLGRLTTLPSLSAITLDDVKQFFGTVYKRDGAIMVLSGDISVLEGQSAAARLLAAVPAGNLPAVDYAFPEPPAKLRIVLIDKPDAQQAAIRLGARAYSLRSDEKFTGSLTNQILSAGIESRLGRYVRAEKGYAYDVSGVFSPSRQAGAFIGDTDTRFESAADAVTAMFKVFGDMKTADVPEKELAETKFRVAGNLLMAMQTTSDQADRRLEGMLNGYPADYYDKYAQRIGQVTAAQIRQVMNQYAQENRMVVVVVGPAATLKPLLEKLGTVEVVKPPSTGGAE